MKRNLLLTLLTLVAATATATTTMIAQDELEQTAPPVISCEYPSPPTFDTGTTIIIENSEDAPDAEIYYSVCKGEWYHEPEEWILYQEPLYFNDPGQYFVWAYAQLPGLAASETVMYDFEVNNSTIEYLYDFIVDGIYYMHQGSDDEVWVTTEGFEYNDYYPLPQPISHCYSGDVVIPERVAYDGKTYTVTGIYHEAFMGCDITSLDLPATMTNIFEFNFYSTHNLSRVICRAITPPEVELSGNWEINGQLTLFVPTESIEVYRNAEIWCQFHIIPFIGAGPGDVNGDGNIAVSDVTNLIDQLLGGDELPAYADVNGDGEVTIKDITDLIDMLLNGN